MTGPNDLDGADVPPPPRSEACPIPSAQEWGQHQAETAPPWSDAKWRRVNALLRIDIAPPACCPHYEPGNSGS